MNSQMLAFFHYSETPEKYAVQTSNPFEMIFVDILALSVYLVVHNILRKAFYPMQPLHMDFLALQSSQVAVLHL